MKNKTLITACLLAVLLLLTLTACAARSPKMQLDGVTRIELQGGTTGAVVEITAPDEVAALARTFAELKHLRTESSANATGWSYRLRFYAGTELREDVAILGSQRLSRGGYFYDITAGEIDFAYLDTLLEGARNE